MMFRRLSFHESNLTFSNSNMVHTESGLLELLLTVYSEIFTTLLSSRINQ